MSFKKFYYKSIGFKEISDLVFGARNNAKPFSYKINRMEKNTFLVRIVPGLR